MLVKDKSKVTGLGRISGSAIQVLDAMFARPISNISALAKATGLTPATIGKALDSLQYDAEIVREVSGRKRNRIFTYTEYIQILNEEVD
jgi:DNA-binding MarR family transcriptional regulator